MSKFTVYQSQFFAWELTQRAAGDSVESLGSTLVDAQVDLNPHQIDGEDPGDITKTVDWKGGGDFRYYRLAPSLLEKDKWGNLVVNARIQRRHAGRGPVQAGRLHLCAVGDLLVAARPLP